VIVTDDLVTALQEGSVRGAALDVTSPEPIPAAHPLCLLDNCLIIPHIGTATVECREKMARLAAENIIKHMS
jgi:phosphoglycerate dehydrogenase-like enzyme